MRFGNILPAAVPEQWRTFEARKKTAGDCYRDKRAEWWADMIALGQAEGYLARIDRIFEELFMRFADRYPDLRQAAQCAWDRSYRADEDRILTGLANFPLASKRRARRSKGNALATLTAEATKIEEAAANG